VLISSFLITFFYSIDVSFVSQKNKKRKNQKSNGKQKGQRAKMQIKKNRDQNEMELLGAKQYKRK
jgi:hypothetical protein